MLVLAAFIHIQKLLTATISMEAEMGEAKVAKFMEKLTREMKEGMEKEGNNTGACSTKNQSWSSWIWGGWSYSAPDYSADDLAQLGFDDHCIQQTTKFLKDIKRITTEMRKGGELADNGWIQLYNENGGVPYHDILWPHWREFAAALKLYKTGYSFDLTGVELPLNVRCILWDALKDNKAHFKRLRFAYQSSYFDNDEVQLALGLLKTFPQVQKLELINHLGNDNVDVLCDIIRDHPSIVEVELLGCLDDMDGYEALCSLIESEIRKIGVSYNEIYSDGRTALSDVLARNPRVEEISLDHNELDDDDATGIANALKTNTNLKSLMISDNEMTDIGEDALRGACFDLSSLNAAADSNHTCFVYTKTERQVNDTSVTAKANRRVKIYRVLASRNKELSNIEHFGGDVGIKLLPNILTAVKLYATEAARYSRQGGVVRRGNLNVKPSPLSIFYELMRNWDEALNLYQSLGRRQSCRSHKRRAVRSTGCFLV